MTVKRGEELSSIEDEIRSLVRQVIEGLLDEMGPPSGDAAGQTLGPSSAVSGTLASPSSHHTTIAIGADHGGYHLKQVLIAHLRERGYGIHDCGTHSPESVDYPDFAEAVARLVAGGICEWGIVVDGAGIGSCMAANKVPGIRAALCYDISTARNSREHNHANVLTLGAGLIGENLARQIVDEWLATPFGPGRHQRRVEKIMEIERRYQIDREELINAVTREVLAALAGQSGNACLNCLGNCAAHCPNEVRTVVAAGAHRITYNGDGAAVPADLARYIDHTALKPETTAAQIDQLCAEAVRFGFAAVCVNPVWIKRAAHNLRDSGVGIASVIGFPLGANVAQIKAVEARQALRDGATELDMVINIGALKSRHYDVVHEDIAKVADASREVGAICKVIIEAALLTDEEKVIACRLAQAAKADYVKTSTGFGPGGATVYDVMLMRETVGPKMGIKAAGGIKTAEEARQMIAAGATRIGASASVKIIEGASA